MRTSILTIGRQSSFEMAHRLRDAVTAECNDTIHGHSYKWSLEIDGTIDPLNGMVLDYKSLTSFMHLVETHLDHALWMPCAESLDRVRFDNKKLLCAIGTDGNGIVPTAENMVTIIATTVIREWLYARANITGVTVQLKETENSFAKIYIERKSFLQFLDEHPVTVFDCVILPTTKEGRK